MEAKQPNDKQVEAYTAITGKRTIQIIQALGELSKGQQQKQPKELMQEAFQIVGQILQDYFVESVDVFYSDNTENSQQEPTKSE